MSIPDKQTMRSKFQKQQDEFKKRLSERFEGELANYADHPIIFCFPSAITPENVEEIVAQVKETGWDVQFCYRKRSGWEFVVR